MIFIFSHDISFLYHLFTQKYVILDYVTLCFYLSEAFILIREQNHFLHILLRKLICFLSIQSELQLESRLSITSYFDQSRSFVDQMTDSKLHWKEINDNEGNENMQVNGIIDNNSKRVSIHKRPLISSIAFETRTRKLSEKSLYLSYPANDQNE